MGKAITDSAIKREWDERILRCIDEAETSLDVLCVTIGTHIGCSDYGMWVVRALKRIGYPVQYDCGYSGVRLEIKMVDLFPPVKGGSLECF